MRIRPYSLAPNIQKGQGLTGLSKELLHKIVLVLGCLNRNVIDERELEMIIFDKLGQDPYVWANIIQTKFKNESLGQEIFKSFLPLLPKQLLLLDSKMIQDALRVYENMDIISFHLFGPFSLSEEFTSDMITRKANKLAFVFNTSNTSGHWVVLYVDISENEVNYFDSFGSEPSDFMKQKIDRTLKALRIEYPSLTNRVLFSNSKNKQEHGVDCGVYVVWFVVQRLTQKKSFYQISQQSLPDHECRKLRNVYWNEVDMDLTEFQSKE